MLEKAIRVALEKDEPTLEELYLRGHIFITEDGVASDGRGREDF